MSRPPVLNENTVGTYFIDEQGDIWRHIAYSHEPTATLEKVREPGKRVGGVVGAPIFEGFIALIESRDNS